MRSRTLPTSLMASAAVGSSMMTTLGVEGGGAGDGDRLALAAGQLLDVLVDALDVDLEPVEVLRRHLAGPRLVDDGEAADACGRARGRDRCSRRSACSRRARSPDRPSRCRRGGRRAGSKMRPAAPSKTMLALARRVEAGEDLHQGRLAGAVVADDAEHLARRDMEVHVAQRGDGAEILVDAAGLEDGRQAPADARRGHQATFTGLPDDHDSVAASASFWAMRPSRPSARGPTPFSSASRNASSSRR